MRKIYPFSFLFLFLTPVALLADNPFLMVADSYRMSFQEINKLVVVEAVLDGQRGYFILDTGIGTLTLNESRCNYEESISQFNKVSDVNGKRDKAEGVVVGTFEWGGLLAHDFQAPLLNMESLEKILKIELLGLIGYDVIRDMELFIDYDAKVLVQHRLSQDGRPISTVAGEMPTHQIPFVMEGHLPVMRARVGELALRMGWDSAATINMMNRKYRRDLPEDSRKLLRIPYGGVLSSNRAPFIAVDAINIDDQFSVMAWRMACTPMRHFSKRDINIDGLIGADLLRLGCLSINYQRQEIYLWVNDNIFAKRYEALPTFLSRNTIDK